MTVCRTGQSSVNLSRIKAVFCHPSTGPTDLTAHSRELTLNPSKNRLLKSMGPLQTPLSLQTFPKATAERSVPRLILAHRIDSGTEIPPPLPHILHHLLIHWSSSAFELKTAPLRGHLAAGRSLLSVGTTSRRENGRRRLSATPSTQKPGS